MGRKYQAPTITPDDIHGEKFEHPAYATVNISRCSGQVELFDSALKHQHFISLTIKGAEKFSDGAVDHIHSRESYIEVWMSETQYARMLTSMNMGSGAPCTLVRKEGKQIPALVAEDTLNSHADMVTDKLKGTLSALSELGDQINTMRQEKHRPTLKELSAFSREMDIIGGHFKSNMGFYAKCFEEHMERVVDEAKAEIESHVLSTAGKLGMQQDEFPRIEGPNDPN